MRCFDLQVNGAFGVDFSAPDMATSDFVRASKQIIEHGVTRFLPTVITSSMELYRKRLPQMVKAISENKLDYEMPGFHLEGPFISDKTGAVGAHNPAWVLPPTPETLLELYNLAEGRIKLMTFAAEVDGVKETIAAAHELGISCSLGHQLANSQDMANANADCLTHLGNGIPNMIDRHHNSIWSGLANDDLTALIITDGHHLPDEVIKCMIRCKGVDKIIVTSDASSSAGLPPGRYKVLGNDAILEPNGKLHNPEKQCLVGSASLMVEVSNYLNSLNLLSNEELDQVIWKNPHKLLGLEIL